MCLRRAGHFNLPQKTPFSSGGVSGLLGPLSLRKKLRIVALPPLGGSAILLSLSWVILRSELRKNPRRGKENLGKGFRNLYRIASGVALIHARIVATVQRNNEEICGSPRIAKLAVLFPQQFCGRQQCVTKLRSRRCPVFLAQYRNFCNFSRNCRHLRCTTGALIPKTKCDMATFIHFRLHLSLFGRSAWRGRRGACAPSR